MKTLLVGGCSWTAADFTSAWDRSVRYKNPWPNQLATMLGDDWNVYNVAKCGNNNQRIAQDIVSAIETGAVKPDLVVVMWSDWGRFDFGYHKVVPYAVFMAKEDDPIIKLIIDSFGEKGLPLYRSMVKLYMGWAVDIKTVVERNMHTMFMLSTYLQHKGIEHYFVQGIEPFGERIYKRMIRRNLLPSRFSVFGEEGNWARGILDSSYYRQLENTPNYGFPWLPSLGGECMLRLALRTLGKERHMITNFDHHPSEESHKLIAETIYENLY